MQSARARLGMTCPVTRDQTKDRSMVAVPSLEMQVAHPARDPFTMEASPSVKDRITRDLVRVDSPATRGDAMMVTIRQMTDPKSIRPLTTKMKETLPWTQS